MQLKLSNKYQVIIPKAARKKMNLERGLSYMTVKHVTDNEITFMKSPVVSSDIEKYAGVLREEWGKNSVARLRKIRDEDWD